MDMTPSLQIADIKLALGFDSQLPGMVIRSTWMESPDNLSSDREMVTKNCSQKRRGNEPEGPMSTTATYGTLSASEHSTQLRKAVIASTIGTAIEWYDFFLYGTAAGLIFGKLFFPNSDPLTATLAAFGTYFIGFVGRPIGAAIFGQD